LIDIPKLQYIGVDIYLNNKKAVWVFKITPKIKIDNKKQFTTRMKKSPKVYTLVLKNITFNDISSPENNNTINRIPATLQEFLDVFNKEGTTTFIPYRPGVDLNIEFQEGKQPLYGPFYPLSSTELEVL